MKLPELLHPDRCFPRLKVASKDALISELSRRAGTLLVIAPEPLAAALRRREDLGSTGLGAGIAIPHARLPGVLTPAGFLCTLRHPIEFSAIDGRPVDLAFVLLLPTLFHAEHLNALALVARRFREPATCDAVRKAETAEALCRAFLDGASG